MMSTAGPTSRAQLMGGGKGAECPLIHVVSTLCYMSIVAVLQHDEIRVFVSAAARRRGSALQDR